MKAVSTDTFRTCVPLRKGLFGLSPRRPGLLIGSCFSDEVGARMADAFWDVSSNPAGTLFNPVSIASAIRLALSESPDLRLFEAGSIWRSWNFPTTFTGSTRGECEGKCLAALNKTREALLEADFLIATFGSAIVYEVERQVVANCHKQPASTFTKRMLAPSEIADDWERLLQELSELNPGLKVIFTVSPVRHLADGLHTNNLSKGTLHLSVDDLLQRDLPLPEDYFPAYEILTDDLRDYRFYAEDMTHPSPTAVDYIWKHFQRTYLDDDARAEIAEGEALSRRLRHRPLIPDSPEALHFAEATRQSLADFLRRTRRLSDTK